jgi:hypothetical protein
MTGCIVFHSTESVVPGSPPEHRARCVSRGAFSFIADRTRREAVYAQRDRPGRWPFDYMQHTTWEDEMDSLTWLGMLALTLVILGGIGASLLAKRNDEMQSGRHH